MIIVIYDNEKELLEVPDRSATVLAYITQDIVNATRRLGSLVGQKVAPGGTAFIAQSLADVMERL